LTVESIIGVGDASYSNDPMISGVGNYQQGVVPNHLACRSKSD
jgi:hypothetical protein